MRLLCKMMPLESSNRSSSTFKIAISLVLSSFVVACSFAVLPSCCSVCSRTGLSPLHLQVCFLFAVLPVMMLVVPDFSFFIFSQLFQSRSEALSCGFLVCGKIDCKAFTCIQFLSILFTSKTISCGFLLIVMFVLVVSCVWLLSICFRRF